MTLATLPRLLFCFVLTTAVTNVATAAPADEHSVVLNACIDAFVRAKQLSGRSLVIRTKDAPQPPIRVGNDYHVQLSAVATRSRQFFGGARCVVQRDGVVRSLNGKPVETGDAETRLAGR